jgi:hypothetical protein
MNYLPVNQAWKLLGKQFPEIYESIKKLPLARRGEEALIRLTEAKQIGRKLLAQNHPDVGGNIHKFQSIQDAIASIEFYTHDFLKKLQSKLDEREKKRDNQVFIVIEK